MSEFKGKIKFPHCDHCKEEYGAINDSCHQLCGKNLCEHHLDSAVTVKGVLLSPQTVHDLENMAALLSPRSTNTRGLYASETKRDVSTGLYYELPRNR